MRQEMTVLLDGKGISWTICKQSAPRSIQTTTPTPHHSMYTGRMLFLPPNHQSQSTRTHAHTDIHTHTHTQTYTDRQTDRQTDTHSRSTALIRGYPSELIPQKGKTNLDFTEARDIEWKWNPLGHMQLCTSLQTNNHASTPPLSFLQAKCPSCRPTNSVKALKGINSLKALKAKCKKQEP